MEKWFSNPNAPGLDSDDIRHAKVLKSIFDKYRGNYKGEFLYRGIGFPIVESLLFQYFSRLEEGDVFLLEDVPTSYSKTIEFPQRIAKFYSTDKTYGVLLKMKTTKTKGYDVGIEVIMKPNLRIRVVKKTFSDAGIYLTLDLEEF